MVAAKAVRKVTLPEGLDLDVPDMSKKDVDDRVQEYRVKQKERFEQRLGERVERFAKKLMDKGSVDREVLVRKILIENLKSEIRDRRTAVKSLRQEIGALKPKRRRVKEKVA